MTTAPHYHIGILVDDLERARQTFGRALGIDFAEISERTLELIGTPPTETTIRLCYSIQGPPYYELVEAVDDGGLFDRCHGEGLHHVGVFVADAAAEKEAMARMEVATEFQIGRVQGPQGETRNLAWFNDPGDLHGVRFEFVDDTMRPEVLSRLVQVAREAGVIPTTGD